MSLAVRVLQAPHLYSLMNSAENIKLGRKEDRPLLCVSISPAQSLVLTVLNRTGVHTVADVFCLGCNDRLGWFYHKATDPSQKYKEGEVPCNRW